MNVHNAHWIRKQHQIYNMTNPAQNSNELTHRLFEAKRDVWNEYMESKQFETLVENLSERTMQKVNVEIVDKARPAIKELSEELNSLLR